LDKTVALVTSEALLAELEDVLNRDHIAKLHKLTLADIQELITRLSNISAVVPVEDVPSVSPDPDDDILFACTVVGQADYIVSGDKKTCAETWRLAIRSAFRLLLTKILQGRSTICH
jgi:putative PIN family toxin of toxin-antitoxin system